VCGKRDWRSSRVPWRLRKDTSPRRKIGNARVQVAGVLREEVVAFSWWLDWTCENPIHANFLELRLAEVQLRRINLPRLYEKSRRCPKRVLTIR
jgi:hypothetical protein